MVGTSALFLNNVDDQVNCKDINGATSGLPDLPFVTTELVQQCSPDTFPMAPPQILCSSQGQHPQTYQANVGRGYYYKQKYGNLHGIYIYGNDVKAAENSTIASLGQLRNVCCTSDQDFSVSAAAPQSAYTPFVQAMKNKNSNYGQSTSAFSSTVSLRREAQLQGVSGVKVWDCGTQCYNPQLLTQGGAAVDGEYVDALYLPFLDAKEQAANPMVAAFVKYTGADKAGGLGGVYAFVAGLALQQAVNQAVKQGGVNAVTRKNVLAQLNSIHSFNGGGMFGTIDLAGRVASPCHVLLQVQNGKFVRVSPTKRGTFDCAKHNVIHVKLDLQ
jgi:ABC-type branched-subunit amino acid transport system substrate-binding protein